MDVIMAGAGPAGLTLGATLAGRGHRVMAVDRDPGPDRRGQWRRRGVMQFEHPHGFRSQVRDLLVAEWPEAWAAWLDLGGEPIELPSDPPSIGVRSRRVVYERALRRAAADVDGLTLAPGTIEQLVVEGGQIVGAIVDGRRVEADLVVDAGGRLSRLAPPPVLHGDTGMSYVTRSYQRHAGAPPGPGGSPVAWSGYFVGYDAYVFFHEGDQISVVLVRPTADDELGALRHLPAFEVAARSIPAIAAWTDPRHAAPSSPVYVGGRLHNTYRPQVGRPGLVTVGDAVTTTAPTAGRGVAMVSMQIEQLLRLLDAGADPITIAEPFGAWCDANMRPWVEDHLAMDAESVRRWQGHDLDLAAPLTSSAIVAAAPADERIGPHIGSYMAMTALPESVRGAEPLARAVYESGWRPPLADGPTRDELVAAIDAPGTRRQEQVSFLPHMLVPGAV
jgi:2-polyprenyl-6-methoxyphenol hydroxylase-like FAD-dependent oxidoreductase